jgi:serine phosphatase RsbU (regulator of sigma subunit)
VRTARLFFLCTALASLWLGTGPPASAATAEPGEPFALTATTLGDAGAVPLPAAWRQIEGDDPAFASPAFDDSAWQPRRSWWLREGWPGIGWFRLRIVVGPELVGEPLGLFLTQAGASELFLDGEPLVSYGTIDADPDAGATRGLVPLQPHIFTLSQPGEHLLAMRYANPRFRQLQRVGRGAGFRARIGRSEAMLAELADGARWQSGNLGLFSGIFLSFGLLHLLLFAFHRDSRENLWFAALCADCALLVFALLYRGQVADPRIWIVTETIMNPAGLLFGVIGLRFVYGIFYPRLPRWFRWGVVPAAVVLGFCSVVWPARALLWIFMAMLASSAEMIRAVVVAVIRRRLGARLIGFGVVSLALGFAIGLLANLGIVPASRFTTFTVPFLGVVVLVASMSVYLSQSFARTQRDLRQQLARVEELSAQRLAQERRLRREEVERKLLAAENERRGAELEEARQLQLSMLPDRLPAVPGLEIAAFMETATEVGGDYYDFDLADDGSLLVAIGDATGHGLRAGTVVTATKSLFGLLSQEASLTDDNGLAATLQRAARVLRGMKLRRLAMALTLARFESGNGHRTLRLAAAGMPPAFVHRAHDRSITTLLIGGAPLGTMARFPYQQTAIPLAPGDTILLMSDGFPERQNAEGELIGYERTEEEFQRVAGNSPQAIIDHLRAVAQDWAGELAAEDDVTFVVVKVGAIVVEEGSG